MEKRGRKRVKERKNTKSLPEVVEAAECFGAFFETPANRPHTPTDVTFNFELGEIET